MIPAIVTLAVGIIIVIVSFFMTDGNKNESETGAEGKMEDVKQQLDMYCDSLVAAKKEELKKQGDEVILDMQRSFDEAKNQSRTDMDKIISDSKNEIDRYRDDAKKDIDGMHVSAEQKIGSILKAYEASIEVAKKKMEAELSACESQLSEKAKKQMIEYINKSLAEAYEAYNPDDETPKEPISYDESEDEIKVYDAPDETVAIAEDIAAEKAESGALDKNSSGDEVSEEDDTPTEVLTAPGVISEPDEDNGAESGSASLSDNSAFTVVEAYDPEKTAEKLGDGAVTLDAPKKNLGKPKKKKKKKAPNRPVDIWDEGVDTESRVAELHKKGLSIMEIANKLGIGVGEAKVMIDNLANQENSEQ